MGVGMGVGGEQVVHFVGRIRRGAGHAGRDARTTPHTRQVEHCGRAVADGGE